MSKVTVINQNSSGAIMRAENIPNTLFNFYILKRKRDYIIGVEFARNPEKFMILYDGFKTFNEAKIQLALELSKSSKETITYLENVEEKKD